MKHIKNHNLVNGRFVGIQLHIAGHDTHIFPHTHHKHKDRNEKNANITNNLKKRLIKNHESAFAYVYGDFNARLHARLPGEENVMEQHVFGRGRDIIRQNEEHNPQVALSRRLLVDFCIVHGYKI